MFFATLEKLQLRKIFMHSSIPYFLFIFHLISVYSVLICLLSYLVLIVLFYYKERMDNFAILISHGGGVYFVVSSFSCLISYNRYQIIRRGIEKNSIIDAANNRLLEQNENNTYRFYGLWKNHSRQTIG